MGDGSTEGRTLSLELPVALDEWLTERSAELELDRSELAMRVLGGYRAAAVAAEDRSAPMLEGGGDGALVDLDATVRKAVDAAVAEAAPDEAAIAERVAARLDDRIEDLSAETDEKLADIRRRVVQLKQETEDKAPADHGHPELERFDEVAADLETLSERVADLEAEGSAALAADVADLETKVSRLAGAVVRFSEADADDEGARLDHIRRVAAREGHEQAACEACGETVHVGLLPEARCPHCDYPFDRLVGGSGTLFGTGARLAGGHEAASGEGNADEGGQDE